MIFVLTSDAPAWNAAVSAHDWGRAVRYGDAAYIGAFALLPPHEDVCLVAHGNDFEIGDTGQGGWSWNSTELAVLLSGLLPAAFIGNIYVYACMNSIANFSTRLRLDFDANGLFPGTTCLGCNTSVSYRIPRKTELVWQWALPAINQL